MRLVPLLLMLAVNIPFLGISQQATHQAFAEELANTINIDDLKGHLFTLADDDMEGRETGTPGQKRAAEYLANQFEKMGLPAIGEEGGYFQKIFFNSASWENLSFRVRDEEIKNFKGFFALPGTNPEQFQQFFSQITFLGYGIDDENYSDYKGKDVAGKGILIYSGEPFSKKGISHISGTEEPSEWSTDLTKKLVAAKQNGVSAVLIISSDFSKEVQQARRQLVNRGLELGEGRVGDRFPANYVISSTLARELLGGALKKTIKQRKQMEKRGKPRSSTFSVNVQMEHRKNLYELTGENVMGFIEGTDPVLKGEIVVVSAHYDHLGKRGDAIYNGADDNASGTSTVLEIVEALVQAKEQGIGPRRSVLALLVSGEEKGLLGSQYFSENPVFPLEDIVADLNVDMIGRVDSKHEDNPNYIYVIGSDRLSTELHEVNETANTTYTQIDLDYTYNAEDDPNRFYYRSDHYNFAKKGIPSIFYFSGTHKDYHRTTDTPEKIMYEKMMRVGKLIFYTTWEIANRDQRLIVDKKN